MAMSFLLMSKSAIMSMALGRRASRGGGVLGARAEALEARAGIKRVEIKVDDVVVRGHVAKENALEVVTIPFPTRNARYFNADAGAEKLQVSDFGFLSV
jgi:hypothetical protein